MRSSPGPHGTIAFTIQTYQHVLPGMQADAARLYQRPTAPVPPDVADSVEPRGNRPEEDRLTPVDPPINDEGPGR